MNGRIRKLMLMAISCIGLGFSVENNLTAQAVDNTCKELKQDISEMKTDLKEIMDLTTLDAEDASDLMKTIADVRKDFQEYIADKQSDKQEINHAQRGLRFAREMEDGVKNKVMKTVLASYAEIISIYEWFYDDEGCK